MEILGKNMEQDLVEVELLVQLVHKELLVQLVLLEILVVQQELLVQWEPQVRLGVVVEMY
jgi:hypothetical protein